MIAPPNIALEPFAKKRCGRLNERRRTCFIDNRRAHNTRATLSRYAEYRSEDAFGPKGQTTYSAVDPTP